MRNTAPKFRKALNDAANAVKRFSDQLDKISERWKIVPLIKFPTTKETQNE